MKTKIVSAVVFAALLSSCSLFKEKEYVPEYLREASPLDPPGTQEAREALRNRIVKEGTYSEGERLEVQSGKVFLFYRNPDYSQDTSGRMVETSHATVISCEGLYYYVKTEDDKRGYLRETDLVNPVRLVPTTPATGDLLPGEAPLPLDMPGVEGEAIPLNGNQRLMTNSTGRTVMVVEKNSDRSNEFEERRRRIQEAGNNGQPPAQPETPAVEPLPEPAAEQDN